MPVQKQNAVKTKQEIIKYVIKIELYMVLKSIKCGDIDCN